MGKRGRYSHEKKVEVLARIRNQSSGHNIPMDKSSAGSSSSSDDDSAIGSDQSEKSFKMRGSSSGKKTKTENLRQTCDALINDDNTSNSNMKSQVGVMVVPNREEVNVIIDELLEVNKRLYGGWIEDKNCNKDALYAQYLVSRSITGCRVKAKSDNGTFIKTLL